MRNGWLAVMALAFLASASGRGFAGAAGPAAADGEWPCWRGPQRDGKSPDKGLLKSWPAGGPKLLWKAENIGKGFSTIAVSGGTVYATGDVDANLKVFAFDMTGKPKWSADAGPAWTGSYPGSRSTPAVDGGKIYLVTGGGLVGCYDAKNGAKVWSREMKEFGGRVPGWAYSESVLIHENLAVVTPGGKTTIVALDKTTGQNAWTSTGLSYPAHYGSCTAFTFQKVPAIVAGTGGGLACVDARTGAKLWSNDFCAGNTANCPTPVYSDGYVFWANGYGKGGVCMKLSASGNAVTASEAWTTKDMVCHHGGYVVENGFIYGNHDKGWACLDLKTGAKKWDDKGVGKGSVCFADGMLYLFSENGTAGLAAASPDRFQMAGTFKVQGAGPSWAHPVVVGGRLYLRYDTNLYCYDVKTGQ